MTREQLKDYKYNKEYIKDRMDFVEEYSESINRLTSTISDMPNGSRKVEDGMAEKLAKLLDYNNDVINEIAELQNQQKSIVFQLRKVKQPYRNILYKVYIKGESLVDVASEMKYNYEYMKRMHGIALNIFDKEGEKE